MELELIIGGLGLAFSAISFLISRRAGKKQRDIVLDLQKDIKHKIIDGTKSKLDVKQQGRSTELWKSFGPIIESVASASGSAFIADVGVEDKQMIKDKVDNRIEELTSRLSVIEDRTAAEPTGEKATSVNEAILATQVENISKSIDSLEKKMLTKWDVAKIVSGILLLLFGVIGGIAAVISLFL